MSIASHRITRAPALRPAIAAMLMAMALGACALAAIERNGPAAGQAQAGPAAKRPGTTLVLWPTPFPALGLTLRDLGAEELARRQLPYGVLVEAANDEAERSGVRTGDVIIAVGETAAPTLARFWELVEYAGPRVVVFVVRGDEVLKFELGNLDI